MGLAPDGSSIQTQRIYTTEQGMFDVSKNKNVIVLVVDTVDSLKTKAVYDNYPEMLDEFTGFTWYQNSTGSMIPTRYGFHSCSRLFIQRQGRLERLFWPYLLG